MIGYLEKLLNKRASFLGLLLLNALMILGVLAMSRNVVLSDAYSYIGLAEGILHGEYSMWWALEGEHPDTFRTPGYPMLIAALVGLSGSPKSVLALNMILYVVSIWMTICTIRRMDDRLLVASIFLLLLLPLLNIPFYIGQVYPEIPTLFGFCAIAYLTIGVKEWSYGRAILIAAIYAFIFQLRPVFILLPFVHGLILVVSFRRIVHWRHAASMVVAYGVLLLPYGYWNLQHHGVFKLTPLEGGGGALHFGQWGGKIPGYTEHYYWGNFTGDELVRFVPEEEVPEHVRAYEQEWEGILARITPLMGPQDSLMLANRRKLGHGLVPTYNARFTSERERLLTEAAVQHALDEPLYTLAYKCYSAVRLWVIGVQRGEYREAGTAARVKMLYATCSTLVVFLAFLLLVPWALKRHAAVMRQAWVFLLMVVYAGVIHIPFTIQARYTTPVRFAMLALLALAIAAQLRGSRELVQRGADGPGV